MRKQRSYIWIYLRRYAECTAQVWRMYGAGPYGGTLPNFYSTAEVFSKYRLYGETWKNADSTAEF